MDFGPVVVSNASIKDKLLVTQRDLVTRLLKLLQTAPKDAMAAANKRYKELQVQFLCSVTCPWIGSATGVHCLSRVI